MTKSRLLGLYYALDVLTFFLFPIIAWFGPVAAVVIAVQCVILFLLFKRKISSRIGIPVLSLMAGTALFYILTVGFTAITVLTCVPPIIFLVINVVLLMEYK